LYFEETGFYWVSRSLSIRLDTERNAKAMLRDVENPWNMATIRSVTDNGLFGDSRRVPLAPKRSKQQWNDADQAWRIGATQECFAQAIGVSAKTQISSLVANCGQHARWRQALIRALVDIGKAEATNCRPARRNRWTPLKTVAALALGIEVSVGCLKKPLHECARGSVERNKE
jgi:hypothetical protein